MTTYILDSNHRESRSYQFLLDTGADISILPRSMLNNTGVDIQHNNRPVFSVTGDRLPIVGKANVMLKLGNKKYEYTFMVSSDDLDIDGIIGFDFFSYFKFSIDGDNQLLVDGDNRVPYGRTRINSLCQTRYHPQTATTIIEGPTYSFRELKGDLFSASKDTALAHCVGGDFEMSQGIAVQFRNRFGNKGFLKSQKKGKGKVAYLRTPDRYVYYLITKYHSTDKPHFGDLVRSLHHLKRYCQIHEVKKLAIPRLGCGLDQLEWIQVRNAINDIFKNTDIQITAYEFQPDQPHIQESERSTRVVKHVRFNKEVDIIDYYQYSNDNNHNDVEEPEIEGQETSLKVVKEVTIIDDPQCSHESKPNTDKEPERENPPTKRNNNTSKPKVRFTHVKIVGNVTIPPRCEYLCEGRQKKILYHTEGMPVLFEPHDFRIKGLKCARLLTCERSDRSIQIRLVNTTEQPLKIPVNTIIGCAQTFDEDLMIPVNAPDATRIATMSVGVEGQEDRAKIIEDMSKLDHLSIEDQAKVRNKLCEYAELFFLNGDEIGRHPNVQHHINTGGAKPTRCTPYRLAHAQRPIADQLIKDQYAKGIIEPSHSPWASPMLLVPKRSITGEQEWRMVVDYRKLNDVTVKDSYPLPSIPETLDLLSNAKYFTTLDLHSSYNHIEIAPDDIEKTAFCTTNGLWQYKRMPFGLCNAPSTWQRLIDTVMSGLTGNSVLIYLDDLIIWSATVEEHLVRLTAVLDRLKDANLKLRPDKCHFLQSEVQYVGHIITAEGIKTNPRTISAVQDYPVPTNVRETRGFLGLTGYYRRFIPNYAHIAKPLTELTKKNVAFEWGTPQAEAFTTLRNALCKDPILTYPDFTKDFILTTDSSLYAAGAILSQKINGVEKVIGYASKQLNPAERRYSTTERELLAVLFGVKYFNCYLYGRHFKIITDHKSLKWLLSLPKPNCKQTRWALTLAEYQFQVEHRPGSSISHADALSRLRVNVLGTQEIREPVEPLWDRNQIKIEQQKDRDVLKLIGNVNTETDFYLDEEEILYKRRTNPDREDRLVIPKVLQMKILRTYHDLPFAGHGGKHRTTELIASRFYWKGLHLDVETYVKNCLSCQKRKNPVGPTRAPLQRFQEVTKPFQRVSMDIVGPLLPTKKNNRYLITFVDHFTKYPIMAATHNQTAETVAKVFVTEVISKYGCPETLLTDRGAQFTGKMFNEVCRLLNIKHLLTQSYNPKCNGAVERTHRVISDIMSHYVEQNDWDEMVPLCLMAMRSSISATTGYSSFYLLHGFDIDLPFETIIKPSITTEERHYPTDLHNKMKKAFEITRHNIRKNTETSERYYNKKSKPVDMKIGDLVLLHTPVIKAHVTRKFGQLWDGPYRIIEQKGPVDFTIRHVYSKKIQIVNVNRIKHFFTFDPSLFKDDLTPKQEAKITSDNRPSEQRIEDPPIPQTFDPWFEHAYTRRPDALLLPATPHSSSVSPSCSNPLSPATSTSNARPSTSYITIPPYSPLTPTTRSRSPILTLELPILEETNNAQETNSERGIAINTLPVASLSTPRTKVTRMKPPGIVSNYNLRRIKPTTSTIAKSQTPRWK